MNERTPNQTKPPQPRGESAEPKRALPRRRTFETLSEENPLICRGID